MDINLKISGHIERAKQELDRVTVELISQGETIMPEKMDLLFDVALTKYETAKTGIFQEWLALCISGGFAEILGDLSPYNDAISALPALARLEKEVKAKEKQMREAWDKIKHVGEI